MKYAVIKSGGKQYRVCEGDIIDVDNLNVKKDEKVIFDNVLLLVSDSATKVGKPIISGEKVEGVILDNIKGDKLYVAKYKAKVRYRKRIGFRAKMTRIRIDKIGDKKETVEKKVKTAVKQKPNSK
jgi:large subunit ribosomal protein L21